MEKTEFMRKAMKLMTMEAASVYGKDSTVTLNVNLDESFSTAKICYKGGYVAWHLRANGTITYYYGGSNFAATQYQRYYDYSETDDHELILKRFGKDFLLFAFCQSCLIALGNSKFCVTASEDNFETFAQLMFLKSATDILNRIDVAEDEMDKLDDQIFS